MAIIDKFCPKCMGRINKKDEKCPQCGANLIKLKKEKLNKEKEKIKKQEQQLEKEFIEQTEEKKPVVIETDDGGAIVDTSSMFSKPEKDQTISNKENDNIEEDISLEEVTGVVEFEKQPKRHKHKSKRKNKEAPEYTVNEDGSYNIDTSDVTYFDNETTSSIRKARGDIKQEKIEWWEIYKWADRMLARRKINKEVKKASRKTPVGIKRGVMITLCALFGWMGAHNFYGGNKKKGWTIVAFDVIVLLVLNIPVLFEIMGIFVGGGLGFTIFALWFTDLFGLIFNKYSYEISKEEFISNLNVETRMKLRKKYVNLDKKVFKEKEIQRLEKKKIKKEKTLNKKKEKLQKKEEAINKRKQEKPKKSKKKKQETDYEIIEHKMD